jgi:hypothetical protein
LWRLPPDLDTFFEFRHNFSPGENRTPDSHLPPVLHQGPYCKTGKKGQYLIIHEVVRRDTVLSHKRTCFDFRSMATPEIPDREIAEPEGTSGSQKPENLTGQLVALCAGKMADNMGGDDTIKGFIAERSLFAICNKDPDPIRIRAGIPAKRCCVGGAINRRYRAACQFRRCCGFTIPAAKFENLKRTREPGKEGGAAAPEPPATPVVLVPGIPACIHDCSDHAPGG